MPWIVAAVVVFIILALATLFLVHARLIWRDMNRRFKDVRERLEREANHVLDELLDGQALDRYSRRTGGPGESKSEAGQ